MSSKCYPFLSQLFFPFMFSWELSVGSQEYTTHVPLKENGPPLPGKAVLSIKRTALEEHTEVVREEGCTCPSQADHQWCDRCGRHIALIPTPHWTTLSLPPCYPVYVQWGMGVGVGSGSVGEWVGRCEYKCTHMLTLNASFCSPSARVTEVLACHLPPHLVFTFCWEPKDRFSRSQSKCFTH